jgi:hypothetical protein
MALIMFFRGLRVSAAALVEGEIRQKLVGRVDLNYLQCDDFHSTHGKRSIYYSKNKAQETAKSPRLQSYRTKYR